MDRASWRPKAEADTIDVDMLQKIGKRYLCYKAGYFIDWCRCVNSLSSCEDSTYQVSVFERILAKGGYFTKSAQSAMGPLALVVEWEEVMEWLEAVVTAEREGKPTPPFERRPPAVVPVSPTEPRPTPSGTPSSAPAATPRSSRSSVQKKLSVHSLWSRARGKSAERNGESSTAGSKS